MLNELIERIRERLLAGNIYRNEAAVRQSIILPVLRELGWDDEDPRLVCPEAPTPTGPIDLTLFYPAPAALIEIKEYDFAFPYLTKGNRRQLYKYTPFFSSARVAVLSNGRAWHIYLPMDGKFTEDGIIEDRQKAKTVDLQADKIQDCIEAFVAYLSFEQLNSGAALPVLTVAEPQKFGGGPIVLPRFDPNVISQPTAPSIDARASIGRVEVHEVSAPSKPIIKTWSPYRQDRT